MTIVEFEARDRADKKAGFAKWMDQPATRMMLSMIPASEHREVLETLLEETYNAGFGSGAGKTAVSFLETIFKNMSKRDPPRCKSED